MGRSYGPDAPVVVQDRCRGYRELSEIEKLREEYREKVKELQDNCRHPDTDVGFMIEAPNKIVVFRLCKRCGKHLDTYQISMGRLFEWAKKEAGLS